MILLRLVLSLLNLRLVLIVYKALLRFFLPGKISNMLSVGRKPGGVYSNNADVFGVVKVCNHI